MKSVREQIELMPPATPKDSPMATLIKIPTEQQENFARQLGLRKVGDPVPCAPFPSETLLAIWKAVEDRIRDIQIAFLKGEMNKKTAMARTRELYEQEISKHLSKED
jgi:hypothetical protein